MCIPGTWNSCTWNIHQSKCSLQMFIWILAFSLVWLCIYAGKATLCTKLNICTNYLDLKADILKALDGSDLAMLTILDLSTAFNTIDHGILLHRLETSYGLQDYVLQWFSSYVDWQMHCIRCGAFESVCTLVLCGVPQGLVLLLYTANLVLLIQDMTSDHTSMPTILKSMVHAIRRQWPLSEKRSPLALTTSRRGCAVTAWNWTLRKPMSCVRDQSKATPDPTGTHTCRHRFRTVY